MKKLLYRFHNFKYRYKLMILILIAGIIPTLIVTCYMQMGMMNTLKKREMENMQESLKQAVDAIDNQAQIYENLIDYLSYSGDLRKVLKMERASDFNTYLKYTQVADPLLNMPQVYHKEIKGITLYADNIQVAHGSTLAPLSEIQGENWYPRNNRSLIRWYVQTGSQNKVIVARKFYDGSSEINAVLKITLDYNKLFEPFEKIMESDFAGIVWDENGNVVEVYAEYDPETKIQAKIVLQRTEMRALQAQINPHFLYNSLSIINWKAIEADEQEISKVTLALSTYYRTSLNRGETMTTVVSEMENIRAYLKIQLIMHDNSFRVEEVYDNTMGSCEIPKLILQPLVENAIDHGLDVSEKIEKVLRIKVVHDELFLYFMVEDNGNGMTEEKASQIVTYRSKGYGVRNVNERIVLLYGEENKIRVESKEGEGTRVCIRIPKKKENGHEKQETKN